MLPEAVLVFVTNEQPTAARRAKPGRRSPSSAASPSAGPKSTSGNGRPFQLSPISPLSRYRRSDYFFKLCFHLRRELWFWRYFFGAKFFVTVQSGGGGVCCEAFGPVIEKGRRHVFLSSWGKKVRFSCFAFF